MFTKYIEAKDNAGNVKGGDDFEFPSDLDEAIETYGKGHVYKHFMDAYTIHVRSTYHKEWAQKSARLEADRIAEARKEFYEKQSAGAFENVDVDTMDLIKKSLKI